MRIKTTNLLRLAFMFLFMAMTAMAKRQPTISTCLCNAYAKTSAEIQTSRLHSSSMMPKRVPLPTSTIHATTSPTGHRSSTWTVCSNWLLPTPTARTSTMARTLSMKT